jgi:hypothetical protein
VHDVVGALSLFFGAPLGQFWLFGGLFVGAIYGLLRRKHRLELFLTTAIVIVPPIVILPFMASMINSHSNFWALVGFMAAVLYVMTGFIGFCMAWIPGVALGYLFGRAIERTDQNGTKA